jgi:hypothetical protein
MDRPKNSHARVSVRLLICYQAKLTSVCVIGPPSHANGWRVCLRAKISDSFLLPGFVTVELQV